MGEMMEATLELDAVRKSYGDFTAVDGVSMEVPPGTIFGLLGPNGAGKTTTIRMIMDILAPDEGEIRFFGRRRTRDDLRRVGYLPEERGLYRKMGVMEHLVFLAELRGVRRDEARTRAHRWLERLDIADWEDKKVEELSKGMQQKIQLVGTVLHEPEILLLDEPFAGLDPINQGLFKDMLEEYKSQGRTILFSTHVMEQAEKLCDYICLISKGRAVLKGRLAEIKREQGGNSYRVVATGDLSRLETVDGVEHAVVRDDGFHPGSEAKILLADGVEGARVLQELVAFLEVKEFASEEPDLEEIFVKAVKEAA
jgi:ABC-2 type transport system ATP-binding protein